jgi:hypothetical protein
MLRILRGKATQLSRTACLIAEASSQASPAFLTPAARSLATHSTQQLLVVHPRHQPADHVQVSTTGNRCES